ncbi:MAG TPA: 30S ribosomal protein S11 [Candidatus Dojkabacteria bacterium]
MKASAGKKERNRKKAKKVQISKGRVFIKSTYNNTIITITDLEGNVLTSSSPGAIGYSGSRKSTAYAATKAAEDAVTKVEKYGIKEASVVVKGTGMGRQAAVKGLRSAGIKINQLSDHTPIPHGGCRPRKIPRK